MKHGSLFSGIGGFDLAAEWMGWENVFHCEWNEFGQKVLEYYWPDAELFTDITKSDFTKYANRIDILSGGFPCQPYSTAGKRLGKDDERHLWPEMLRAIREIRPRWVVGENVSGLISWNGGLVFDEVQADLEAEGYEVQAFVLPACAVNAPHRRDRVWFVGYSEHNGRIAAKARGNDHKPPFPSGQDEIRQPEGAGGVQSSAWAATDTGNANSEQPGSTRPRGHGVTGMGGDGVAANTEGSGIQRDRTNRQQKPQTQAGTGLSGRNNAGDYWSKFPTQPPLCSGYDGLPTQLDGITFSKWRNESIKGYGNAVVPQVVLQIFKAIQEYENTHNYGQD